MHEARAARVEVHVADGATEVQGVGNGFGRRVIAPHGAPLAARRVAPPRESAGGDGEMGPRVRVREDHVDVIGHRAGGDQLRRSPNEPDPKGDRLEVCPE